MRRWRSAFNNVLVRAAVFCTIALSVVQPTSTFAAPNGWLLRMSRLAHEANAAFYRRFAGAFDDDRRDDAFNARLAAQPLSRAERHHAHVWGLNDDQAIRYRILMHQRSGVYYRHRALTPVQILGMNARTDAERRQYAEQAARQMAVRIANELAFNQAYHAAYVRLMRAQHLPMVRAFPVARYGLFVKSPVHEHTTQHHAHHP